ncbi:hypothetical protein [Zavarzinella formosa]|uniref:hypothetical protein n=1 Tax=Zavarzinella formosa TaxID=360055 RepID=UPI000371FD4D|nr:hypothetical protein [Zavarzinella formosa]
MAIAFKAVLNGLLQIGLGGETADGHLVAPDLLEHRFDPVEFGAAGWQAIETDAPVSPVLPASLVTLVVWMPALSKTTTRGTAAADRFRRYWTRSPAVGVRSNGTAVRSGTGAKGS